MAKNKGSASVTVRRKYSFCAYLRIVIGEVIVTGERLIGKHEW